METYESKKGEKLSETTSRSWKLGEKSPPMMMDVYANLVLGKYGVVDVVRN